MLFNPNNNPNRRPISTENDIIDEWVKRTGKPRELLEEMYVLHTKYLKELMYNNPDAINIKLPGVGILRLNYHLAKRFRKRFPIIDQRVQKLVEVSEKYGFNIINFKRAMFSTQYARYMRKKTMLAVERFYKIVKFLSEKNNEEFVKRYRSGY